VTAPGTACYVFSWSPLARNPVKARLAEHRPAMAVSGDAISCARTKAFHASVRKSSLSLFSKMEIAPRIHGTTEAPAADTRLRQPVFRISQDRSITRLLMKKIFAALRISTCSGIQIPPSTRVCSHRNVRTAQHARQE